MTTFQPYFEKQQKRTQRADHYNSVDKRARKYPCIKLVHNNDWNDYGYYTWFAMWYVPEKDKCSYIGEVKIMNRNGDAYAKMSVCFEQLSADFCSVGIDLEYYSKLKSSFEKKEVEDVLKALCDCATNTQIYEDFSSCDAFINSLNRDLSTQKAIREAKFLLDGRNMSEAYSFDYRFTPIYNKEIFALWYVRLECACAAYKRTCSVIGENGVGKTQLMANMVEALAKEGSQNISKQPMLSSLIVIYSSEFDAYKKISTDKTRIPFVVCDVVQTTNTVEKLKESINVILQRGTYYRYNEMLMMSERYMKMLQSQLGDCMKNIIVVKEKVGEQEYDKYVLNTSRLEELVQQLSTGQLQIFSLITYVCANIHLNSLIIMDEPEVHLHPRLITKFIVAMNELLEMFDSYAIIATHSPLVVRECVKDNVYMMVRSKYNVPTIGKVGFNTFGEDLTTLYENIFGCDERDSYFYKTIKEMVGKIEQPSYKKVVEELKRDNVGLTLNGSMVVRDYFENQENQI